MKCLVIFEFDEKDLGQRWFNKDNLKLLCYTNNATKENLLQITQFEEIKEPNELSRDQSILMKRYHGMTFESIGEIYGLSRERIRQICKETKLT